MVRIQGWIQTVAAIAGVATAVLAFLIQQSFAEQEHAIQREISKQEIHRAAVSRAVALYRDFVASSAVKDLREISHEIDSILWTKWRDLRGKDLSRKSTEVFKEEHIQKELPLIRKSIATLLQNASVVYKCGKFGDIYEPNSVTNDEKELCDRRTITVLMGSIITEIHWAFRSVMYCDEFIRDRYFRGKAKSSYVGVFESLVEDHLRRDFESRSRNTSKGNDTTWPVFRTKSLTQKELSGFKGL